jgi:type 1 fimbriae regulatory protein FimB/type 1 fimbriae regulatory protein FimE
MSTETEGKRHLTPSEVDRLIKAATTIGRYGARDALMIRVAYVHGLRSGEVTGLLWSDVDLDGRTVYVRRLKGSKNATHPLTKDVIRSLKRLRGDRTGFVFKTERGTPLSPNGFGKIVRRAGEVAGFEFVAHPHMLRHGAGYKLANDGVDTRSLQAYLGHSNIRHTVHYTATSPSRFKNFWND